MQGYVHNDAGGMYMYKWMQWKIMYINRYRGPCTCINRCEGMYCINGCRHLYVYKWMKGACMCINDAGGGGHGHV